MCTYLLAGIYCKFEKKKKEITQGLSVYKNKGEQSISNGKDAIKRVYLNLV